MSNGLTMGPYTIVWNGTVFQAFLNDKMVKEDTVGYVVWQWCLKQIEKNKCN